MNYADNRGVNGEQTRTLTRTKKKTEKKPTWLGKMEKRRRPRREKEEKEGKKCGSSAERAAKWERRGKFHANNIKLPKKKRGKSREFWVLESHFMFVWLAMDNTHVFLSHFCVKIPHTAGHIKTDPHRECLSVLTHRWRAREAHEKKRCGNIIIGIIMPSCPIHARHRGGAAIKELNY